MVSEAFSSPREGLAPVICGALDCFLANLPPSPHRTGDRLTPPVTPWNTRRFPSRRVRRDVSIPFLAPVLGLRGPVASVGQSAKYQGMGLPTRSSRIHASRASRTGFGRRVGQSLRRRFQPAGWVLRSECCGASGNRGGSREKNGLPPLRGITWQFVGVRRREPSIRTIASTSRSGSPRSV